MAIQRKCSAKSGGFGQKLADFRAYGLLDGRGTLHVTEIAIKSTYGTEKEKAEAMDSAVRKIELWRLINAKWGTSVPADSFWIDLAEIAGIERSESKLEADTVRKAYMDDARYLLTVKTPPEEPESKKPDSRDDSEPARGRKNDMDISQVASQKSGGIPFAQFAFGESKAVIMDRTALDVIIGQLTSLKASLEGKPVPPTPDTGKENL